ncbi:MAG: hypothetical protein HEQ32_03310 [Vampirovibrio sp.]
MPLIKNVRSRKPATPTARPNTQDGQALPPWLEHITGGGQHPHPSPLAQDGQDDFVNQLIWTEAPHTTPPTTAEGGEPKRRRSDHEPPVDPQAIFQQAYEEGHAQGIQAGRQEGFTQAQSEGYQHGYEAGHAEGMKEAHQASEEIWQILDQLETIKNQVLEKSVQDIVPMAMAIAQRLIKVEVSCDRALVVGIALDVLGKVDRTQKEVVFKVHPHDVKLLRQHIKDHEETWQGEVQRHIIVVGDADVDEGSCIVETSGGQIDASFHTQLHMIRKILGLPNVAIASQSNAKAEFDHLLEGEHAPTDAWEAPAFDAP